MPDRDRCGTARAQVAPARPSRERSAKRGESRWQAIDRAGGLEDADTADLASRNKPFCDGSHEDAGFSATGEPPTTAPDMLETRDGPLAIDPELDEPLQVRGNLEITSGTGRVVARVVSARLCRRGGGNTKPFCDGTHARIGFRSE